MCPKGAKNHLNMGIVERRYRNWGAALHHFQQAHRLSAASFCEPLYWIGTTRIHSGHDVALGAQVSTPAATGMKLILTGCLSPCRIQAFRL